MRLWVLSLVCVPFVSLAAGEADVGGGTDSEVLQQELAEINASDTADFLKDGSVVFRTTWYSRYREGFPSLFYQSSGDKKFNVLGLALDISSGYLWGILGFDFSFNSNLKIGPTVGQSEILFYDYATRQEKSEAMIGRASLKLKLGGDDNGFKANVGYTPIDVGTIGTSSGLHPHGYRGFDAKYIFHDFELGYGWADQFHNEWTTDFLPITTSEAQNQPPFQNTGKRIDYIHSLGARYKFGPQKSGFVDVGVGQGKDYRNNQQVVAGYQFDLAKERAFNITGYYFQGQYIPELSGVANPSNEWHTSFGVNYHEGPWTFVAGYGKTHAPDSGELNFALAAYGNSDSRDFNQVSAQLDDYIWDGEQAVKLGVNYEIGRLINLPGLVTGVSYNYGWGLINRNANGQVIGRSKVSEIDTKLVYTVSEGVLKGVSAGVYAGWLRGDNDFYGKPPRNDVKFILSYEIKL